MRLFIYNNNTKNTYPPGTIIDPYSELLYNRDQKYFNRYLEPFGTDDIKILSSTNLYNNTNWWDTAY